MHLSSITAWPLLATTAYAHFSINYPYWRGDSMTNATMELTAPCAGIDQSQSASNRTEWPLTGGSVKLTIMHATSVVFMSLAIGDVIEKNSYFNHTLTPTPLNVTGMGQLCLPHVAVPETYAIADGTAASLQVMLYAWDGSWTYSCADITLSSKASLLAGSDCTNATGVSAEYMGAGSAATTASSPSPTASTKGNTAAGTSAGYLSAILAGTTLAIFGLLL